MLPRASASAPPVPLEGSEFAATDPLSHSIVSLSTVVRTSHSTQDLMWSFTLSAEAELRCLGLESTSGPYSLLVPFYH